MILLLLNVGKGRRSPIRSGHVKSTPSVHRSREGRAQDPGPGGKVLE